LASEWISQGEIDALFNFLQIPNQKTSGLLTSHFLLSGTPKTPHLNGEMDIQNGLYENYFIGTKGKNIAASFTASGSFIHLNSFSAEGQGGGSLKATGNLLLDRQKEFPFTISSYLDNFYFINSSLFQTNATGNLIVNGTTQGCKATGDLQIDAATFTLSDRLPQEIPTLPVIHINKPIHLQHSEIIPSSEYPINLNLNLKSDNTVFIKGRGLNSTWHGNVILRGTPTKLIGNGSLTLEKGEFSFSGKTFILKIGHIFFLDTPEPTATLSLVGELTLPSATIIANLQGPLTSPRLTFQSIPGLSTSSILSLILFNKDISEISPFQALQLAQVVMSLSGNGGPDVFGAIRKTIGVDKLSISGKEGSDEIALQIGWCIAHGVTVSLSQSATSSDITIEVDLKNGFLFEAETQNQEEGKFSLKWNHNY
ncbi:MAG: translocation/assembly module TamB domain-containing protein, partial [Verrucomicrobia bacterium]|nr:translocation/assembly module TamB domain-containing protein [Verrucomicrobiota bacterium]